MLSDDAILKPKRYKLVFDDLAGAEVDRKMGGTAQRPSDWARIIAECLRIEEVK